ncbi:unnamed protein product [Amoebophrya sp. A120]|nr:unnamed protein product [Amoebophrya sp. A120]|eukprot:GSA120T00024813001.1
MNLATENQLQDVKNQVKKEVEETMTDFQEHLALMKLGLKRMDQISANSGAVVGLQLPTKMKPGMKPEPGGEVHTDAESVISHGSLASGQINSDHEAARPLPKTSTSTAARKKLNTQNHVDLNSATNFLGVAGDMMKTNASPPLPVRAADAGDHNINDTAAVHLEAGAGDAHVDQLNKRISFVSDDHAMQIQALKADLKLLQVENKEFQKHVEENFSQYETATLENLEQKMKTMKQDLNGEHNFILSTFKQHVEKDILAITEQLTAILHDSAGTSSAHAGSGAGHQLEVIDIDPKHHGHMLFQSSSAMTTQTPTKRLKELSTAIAAMKTASLVTTDTTTGDSLYTRTASSSTAGKSNQINLFGMNNNQQQQAAKDVELASILQKYGTPNAVSSLSGGNASTPLTPTPTKIFFSLEQEQRVIDLCAESTRSVREHLQKLLDSAKEGSEKRLRQALENCEQLTTGLEKKIEQQLFPEFRQVLLQKELGRDRLRSWFCECLAEEAQAIRQEQAREMDRKEKSGGLFGFDEEKEQFALVPGVDLIDDQLRRSLLALIEPSATKAVSTLQRNLLENLQSSFEKIKDRELPITIETAVRKQVEEQQFEEKIRKYAENISRNQSEMVKGLITQQREQLLEKLERGLDRCEKRFDQQFSSVKLQDLVEDKCHLFMAKQKEMGPRGELLNNNSANVLAGVTNSAAQQEMNSLFAAHDHTGREVDAFNSASAATASPFSTAAAMEKFAQTLSALQQSVEDVKDHVDHDVVRRLDTMERNRSSVKNVFDEPRGGRSLEVALSKILFMNQVGGGQQVDYYTGATGTINPRVSGTSSGAPIPAAASSSSCHPLLLQVIQKETLKAIEQQEQQKKMFEQFNFSSGMTYDDRLQPIAAEHGDNEFSTSLFTSSSSPQTTGIGQTRRTARPSLQAQNKQLERDLGKLEVKLRDSTNQAVENALKLAQDDYHVAAETERARSSMEMASQIELAKQEILANVQRMLLVEVKHTVSSIFTGGDEAGREMMADFVMGHLDELKSEIGGMMDEYDSTVMQPKLQEMEKKIELLELANNAAARGGSTSAADLVPKMNPFAALPTSGAGVARTSTILRALDQAVAVPKQEYGGASGALQELQPVVASAITFGGPLASGKSVVNVLALGAAAAVETSKTQSWREKKQAMLRQKVEAN